ncbi:sensor histidine kinase [Enterococcus timonensis]|uniref:sensor histidine kinase n=1 Tax=Enterococcus timonensis TaxID=1852364 RepID=UPI0008D903F5|nr:sensor histidine kinase [Enterococcus timonensis]
MNKIRKFLKKEYLINQLMQLYSILLTGVILFLAVSLSILMSYSNYRSLKGQMDELSFQMENYVNAKGQAVSNIYLNLVGTPEKLDNFRQYLLLSPAEYFNYTDQAWQTYYQDFRFSNLLQSSFANYPDLETLYLYLDEVSGYVTADRTNSSGKKMAGQLPAITGLGVQRGILENYSSKRIGEFVAVFSGDAVLGNLVDYAKDKQIESLIYDDQGTEMYSSSHILSNEEKRLLQENMSENKPIAKSLTDRYFVVKKTQPDQTKLLLLADRKTFWRESFIFIAEIGAAAMMLVLILLLSLRKTFHRYSKQIDRIISVTQQVGDGNLSAQVDTNKVQGELKDVANAINFMVSSLNQYIEEIYVLEIKQKDANMHALQAQINPHFLYNTMEYIRMYALAQGQEELADVVFAFAALLRNNTSQEKVSTLKNELLFCEKYVYLYQMRYPDQIAYNFSATPDLLNLELPKFTIQPIVENYFVHGIDYTRNNNAISVRVKNVAGEIWIEVIDNGKGIAPEKLAELRAKIQESAGTLPHSIGLKNVAERLENYFPSARMEIDSIQGKGTTVTLKIIPE